MMKRRTFVQTAAVTVFGLSIHADVIARPFHQPTKGVQHWLRQLAIATSAQRRSKASLALSSFRERTDIVDAYFARHGYFSDNSGYYFYNEKESCCFYSLTLRHSKSGLQDMLVAVLTLDADHVWRHTHTLTAYQLEALARAANAMTGHQALQALLLPVPCAARLPMPQAYKSQLAEVSISTEIHRGKAATNIRIMENGQTLFQDTFESEHNLTSQPVIA
jgi:hypothetical protein